MKNILFQTLKLTLLTLLLFSGIYTLVILFIAQATPGGGKGKKLTQHGITVGYENIGQKFTADRYFNSRPSAVNYNADGSGASNKGPSNAEYLILVKERIDSFLVRNPGISKSEIPVEMVTASGSGLDPDISSSAALIQVKRIAKIRGMNEDKLKSLIIEQKEKSLLGFFGPEKINVLKLNIALDNLN
ncbi:MAG: K(+)-transporting ATPase subunit C [Bacteroidia bacterium]|nr:K(+)-transporting ATPase subunit C [Bacteroidia bacterium]